MPSISGRSKNSTADDDTSALSWKAADDGGLDPAYVNMEDDASKKSVKSISLDGYVNIENKVNMKEEDENISVVSATSKLSIRSKFSVQSSNITQMVSAVVPKLERLPWSTFLCLSIWCAIPAVVYILLFTQWGFGESFYYALSQKFGGSAYIPASILAGYAFLFYILDMDQWNTKVGDVIRVFSIASLFVLFVIVIMLISNQFPYGVIALFALFQPMWLLSVKAFFYKDTETRIYLNWLGGPLFSTAFLTFIGFVVWVSMSYLNRWNQVTKVMAAERTQCSPDFSSYPNCLSNDGFGMTCFRLNEYVYPPVLYFENNCETSCVHVYDGCSNGFVLWVAPLLMTLAMIFLGSFCTFLRTGMLKVLKIYVDIYEHQSHIPSLTFSFRGSE